MKHNSNVHLLQVVGALFIALFLVGAVSFFTPVAKAETCLPMDQVISPWATEPGLADLRNNQSCVTRDLLQDFMTRNEKSFQAWRVDMARWTGVENLPNDPKSFINDVWQTFFGNTPESITPPAPKIIWTSYKTVVNVNQEMKISWFIEGLTDPYIIAIDIQGVDPSTSFSTGSYTSIDVTPRKPGAFHMRLVILDQNGNEVDGMDIDFVVRAIQSG